MSIRTHNAPAATRHKLVNTYAIINIYFLLTLGTMKAAKILKIRFVVLKISEHPDFVIAFDSGNSFSRISDA